MQIKKPRAKLGGKLGVSQRAKQARALRGIFLLHIGFSIEKQAVSGSLKHVNVMEI
jgi:hypothetical protein